MVPFSENEELKKEKEKKGNLKFSKTKRWYGDAVDRNPFINLAFNRSA